jgi:hypothetical protein
MRTLLPAVMATVTPILMLVLIVGGVALHVVEWQPPMVWSTQFGALGTQNSVTLLSSNPSGLYAGGYINDSPFMSRYDTNGVQVWTEKIGNPGLESLNEIVAATDGIYASLTVNNTLVIVKYSLDGSELWSRQWTNVTGDAVSISVGTTGLYVPNLGTSNPNGTSNILVRRYDFGGDVVWTKILGNEEGHVNIYASSDALYFAGSDTLNFLDTHAFLSKFDLNGTLEWTRLFDDKPSGFICQCELTSVLADSSGLYVLGYSQNGFPLQSLVPGSFMRKYDWNGNVLWTIIINAPDGGAIFSYAVSVSTSGIYFTEGTVPGGNNFIIKYDTNGNNVLTFSIPDPTNAISILDNGIVVGGGSPAFIEEFREPSSLVFFGINPPFSFAAVGGLVAAAALSILYYSRRGKKRPVSKAPVPPKTGKGSDDNPLPRWKPA